MVPKSIEVTGVSPEDADARFDGEDLSDQFGNALGFAGDVDGDGLNTAILIGASKKDTTGADAGGDYLMNNIGL